MPDLDAETREYLRQLAYPSGYAVNVYGMSNLYDWQAQCMNALMEPNWVAVKCCNEAGKTQVAIAMLCLWHMETFPGSLTVTTSGSNNQIENQLYPAIKAYTAKRDEFRIVKNRGEFTPTGSRLVSYSTDDAGRAEGWHEPPKIPGDGLDPDDNVFSEDGVPDDLYRKIVERDEKTSLLMIIDEAKTVVPDIWLAWERCRPTRYFVASSPGVSVGPFYDCFNTDTRWERYSVSYSDCAHILNDPKRMAMRAHHIEHKDADFVASTWDGEFMEAGEFAVFNMAAVSKCMEGTVPPYGRGQKRAGIDLASGGDEVCLTCADGNDVEIAGTWRSDDEFNVADQVILELRRRGIRGEQVNADDGGLGKTFISIFEQKGWMFNRINFGSSANDKLTYGNARAEMFFELANRVKRQELRLPNDMKLRDQLAWQRYQRKAHDGGVLRLVPKDTLPESPDRADSLALCFYNAPLATEYEERKDQIDRQLSKCMACDEDDQTGFHSTLWD